MDMNDATLMIAKGVDAEDIDYLDCEIETLGEERPVEPSVSNEDPEGWNSVADWESKRADYWKGKYLKMRLVIIKACQ